MALYWTAHLEGGPERVNHAAALVKGKIYSFGGYCTGHNYRRRRQIDIFVFSTETYTWRQILDSDIAQDAKCVPYQRYGHTVVSYNTKIYLWGGRDDLAACNILYCFDTVSKKWSCPVVKGFIPDARDGHTACVIDNYMYIFGGFIDDTDEYSEGLHALDLNTFQWKSIMAQGIPPSYRDFHSATCANGKMYVFGGRGDVQGPLHTRQEVYNNTLFVYNPTTNTWSSFDDANAPIGRRSLSTFVHNNKLYIFGGYNGVECQHYNDIHCFDLMTNEWSGELVVYGDPPCRRRRQVCLLLDNKLFMFGGTSPVDPLMQQYPDGESDLIDHHDMYILEINARLVSLCQMIVIKHKLDDTCLPDNLRKELRMMTRKNTMSNQCRNNTG